MSNGTRGTACFFHLRVLQRREERVVVAMSGDPGTLSQMNARPPKPPAPPSPDARPEVPDPSLATATPSLLQGAAGGLGTKQSHTAAPKRRPPVPRLPDRD